MSQFLNPDSLFRGGVLILKCVVHFHVLPSCAVALSNDFLLSSAACVSLRGVQTDREWSRDRDTDIRIC